MTVLILLLAYLIGSVPFSYVVAKLRGVDVRRVGSGNVGATNVMRSAGLFAGLVAFALDAAKGAAAAVIAKVLAQEYAPDAANVLPASAAALAVFGHVFPIWLGFRGGKGVATGAGAFVPLAPLAAGLSVATFAVVLAATRYVSLASIVGATTLAALTFLTQPNPAVSWAAAFCTTLILVRHRENIDRLRRGQERRLGAKEAKP
jgi:acyl phosphate:glycerol-3-phosphate acyltransferase